MPRNIPLTLACGDYEIVRALKDGSVKVDGVDLTLLTAMDSTGRHTRFLRHGEFDAAEVSASGYLAARDRGLSLRAIPVFLHRRFRHGFVFINTTRGIRQPADLIGRKVGVTAFMATATLWLRGILEHEYGVPHRSIEWFSDLDEDVAFTPPAGLQLTRLPVGQSVDAWLADGRLDAVLHTDMVRGFGSDARIGRLFADSKSEEIGYFRRTGIFPIMHVMGIRAEILARHPWVARNLYAAFDQARRVAMRRMENPRIVPLAWYREDWEEQEEILGRDPWEYGLGERNSANLATLIGYSHEQGLIARKMALDELFLNVS
jgi:4,5-dihydroxyphthalate decarboxylase